MAMRHPDGYRVEIVERVARNSATTVELE